MGTFFILAGIRIVFPGKYKSSSMYFPTGRLLLGLIIICSSVLLYQYFCYHWINPQFLRTMNLFLIQINVSRPGLGRIFSIINQNKLETQHVVRINTVYNRKEKKRCERGERRERRWKTNTCASCQSKSTRCENADNNGKWRRALDLFLKGIYNIMCYKNEISNGENLTPARAVNQNRRCAKTLITANGGGVR